MNRSPPPFFWCVAMAAALIACAYGYVGYIVARYGGLSAEFGWAAARDGETWRVSRVDPGGPADGRLQPGDVVLAVNGNRHAGRLGPFFDFTGYEHTLRFVRVDAAATPYIVRVDRGGERDVSLPPLVRHDSRVLATTLSLLATSLAFFVVGTFVGLSRPRDELPRLLALASLPSAVMLMAIALTPANLFLGGWEVYPRVLLANVYPFHYLLAYGFLFRVACGPRRPPFWVRLEQALWVGGVAAAVMRLSGSIINILEIPSVIAFAAEHADPFLAFSRFVITFQRFYNPVLTFATCAVLIANYGSITDATHRRRLKWIAYGTVAGLGPLFVDAVGRTLLAAVGLAHLTTTSGYQFPYRVATTAPILVPIVFGYAIARHRLLGVQVVVRRGLQYLLARNVLRLALALPALGLVYTFAANADKTIAAVLLEGSPFFYGALLVAGVVSVNYRAQLMDWLDRRFFRETYQQEKILQALIEQLNSCESVPKISRLVCDRVEQALHPRAVHVFFRDDRDGSFTLGHSSSGGARLQMPEGFAAVQRLQGRSRLLDLPAANAGQPSSQEDEWFQALDVTMAMAMKGADERLCGLLLLGDKMSEEAYSPNDRELLLAIAAQAAIVWENLWLKEGVRREQQIRRDVLARIDSRGVNLVKECPRCGTCADRRDEVCPVDGTPLELTVPAERTLDGRYRLERRLGRGAMGIVYEAFDERLRRPVAVKLLHGALFGAQEALRRFEREARTSSHLSHPHVVGTHDYGVVGTDGAYLVLELLRGVTWRDELNRTGTTSPPLLAARLDQVLDGLHAAHQAGLVHRDLKPENLMICSTAGATGVVKILDFGLAKHAIADGHTQVTADALTTPGMLLGTYTYMSPEQLTGAAVDARSDLFAVGVIAVESLTGQRPFRGPLLTDLVRAVLHEAFHLDGQTPDVRRLDACLQKALAKNPADRYPSAATMRAALIPAIAGCVSLAPGRADAPHRSGAPAPGGG